MSSSCLPTNISNIEIDQNDNLASLDIQDLYTNIPISKGINNTQKRLEETNDIALTKTDVKELLNLALKNIYFQFYDRFYKQKSGLLMGNTLSPILANIYMDEYQNQYLRKIDILNKLRRVPIPKFRNSGILLEF